MIKILKRIVVVNRQRKQFIFLRNLHIETDTTPNPKSLIFTPKGKEVLRQGTANFQSNSEAKKSPLAQKLFSVEGISVVMLAPRSISVTIDDEDRWKTLTPAVLKAITDFYASNLPIITDKTAINSDSAKSENDSEVVAMIKEVINSRVRPAVLEDGGDVVYEGFENGVVKIRMHGSCVGCPSSTVTLKSGIERLLKYHLPEDVKGVKNVGQTEIERLNEEEYEETLNKIKN